MNKDHRSLFALVAIVCDHVHAGGQPILRGKRGKPTMPEDSGWQFHCNLCEHTGEIGGKVWLVSEVLKVEPSLAALIDQPEGTELQRDSKGSAWKSRQHSQL